MSVVCASPAVVDREYLMSRERERKLQNDLDAVSARLLHQEQLNMEQKMKQDELLGRIHQQQVRLVPSWKTVLCLFCDSFVSGRLSVELLHHI